MLKKTDKGKNNLYNLFCKAQATIDMLVSYGAAILVISIALYVVLQLGIFNTRLAPTYCNAAPSYICQAVAINRTGAITIVFSQATGGAINITGVACSTQANTLSYGPKYGNINMLSYKAAPNFYPNPGLNNGIIVYSSNQTRISAYCYGASGIARGQLGNTFSGFVWINYTINTLPSNYPIIQQMASMTTKYA